MKQVWKSIKGSHGLQRMCLCWCFAVQWSCLGVWVVDWSCECVGVVVVWISIQFRFECSG